MASTIILSLPRAVENLVATSWPSIIVHDPELSGRLIDAGMALAHILPSAMARGRMQNVSTPDRNMSFMIHCGSGLPYTAQKTFRCPLECRDPAISHALWAWRSLYPSTKVPTSMGVDCLCLNIKFVLLRLMQETDWENMDPETLRSYSRMVYGHEIWLENIVRDGDAIRVHGLYGHKMEPDKPMPTDYANPVLYDDDGPVAPPYRDIINDPRGWEFEFPDEGAKVYTLYVDSNSVWSTDDEGWHRGTKREYTSASHAGAYRMVAKTIISRDGEDPGEVMHADLEIMPSKASLKVGEQAELKVLYEGKPMPNLKVIVYCRGWQDLVNMKTDTEGILRLDIKDAGTYAFIAKYADESKSSDDFDETVYTTTLTLEARRWEIWRSSRICSTGRSTTSPSRPTRDAMHWQPPLWRR